MTPLIQIKEAPPVHRHGGDAGPTRGGDHADVAVKNDHATYPYRMMERLGIEPGGGVLPRLSLRYSTVVRGCKDCPATQACGAWLDRAAPTGLPPRFCPNADILFELQLD
jgi:Family of unknown function (DUF6455)